MRTRKLSIALAASALGAMALGALPALGADHKDAPLSSSQARSDINDLYVFKSAGSPNGVVLAMTVNPLTTPADTANLRLDPDTLYEFKVDTNGDAVADISYKITATGTGSVQDVTVRRATGAEAIAPVNAGEVILSGKTSAGANVTTVAADGRSLFVGPRDDPFFFDLTAFNAGLAFTSPGNDTFAGTNITGIVLEVPQAPSQSLGVWATTSKNGQQIDRMGRPAVATVFIPPLAYLGDTSPSQKDLYNATSPNSDEARFQDVLDATLDTLQSPNKDLLSDVLLPDVLTVDLSMPIAYLNGRGLADDVIDGSLKLVTGNDAASDGVAANDKSFSSTFPYMAAPHMAAGSGGGGTAPAPPNTGSGFAEDGNSMFSIDWTLPAGLLAAAALLGAAGFVATRRVENAE